MKELISWKDGFLNDSRECSEEEQVKGGEGHAKFGMVTRDSRVAVGAHRVMNRGMIQGEISAEYAFGEASVHGVIDYLNSSGLDEITVGVCRQSRRPQTEPWCPSYSECWHEVDNMHLGRKPGESGCRSWIKSCKESTKPAG